MLSILQSLNIKLLLESYSHLVHLPSDTSVFILFLFESYSHVIQESSENCFFIKFPLASYSYFTSSISCVIIDVFVREGDVVKIGQKLMLLEAMKMENNIEADQAGKIVSIAKKQGDSVMEGDVLIVIGE